MLQILNKIIDKKQNEMLASWEQYNIITINKTILKVYFQ